MNDNDRTDYRRAEIGGVLLTSGETFRLKVTGDSGESKWLNISRVELNEVASALIGRPRSVDLDAALQGYTTCALWSSTGTDEDGNGGEPLDANHTVDDITPEALASMRADLIDFIDGVQAEYAHALDTITDDMIGHDFWLTRNGHGAGFWDRGLGELGTWLSDRARTYGESDLYVGGDDGRVHVQ